MEKYVAAAFFFGVYKVPCRLELWLTRFEEIDSITGRVERHPLSSLDSHRTGMINFVWACMQH